MISLLLGLLRLDRHGTFLLVLCFLAASRTDATGGTADSTAYAHTANETDAFLQKLADARVLSGTVLVQKDGQLVYSNAFGWASEVSYSLGQAPSAFFEAHTPPHGISVSCHRPGPETARDDIL